MDRILEIIETAYKEVSLNTYLHYFGLISDKVDDKGDSADTANEVIKHKKYYDNDNMLLGMLDEIYMVTSETSPTDDRSSFAVFYNEVDRIVNFSSEEFLGIASECEFKTSHIKERIYEYILDSTWQRMTELYYYYIYHNWYDKELEEAFREVVHEAIKHDDPIATHTYNTNMIFCVIANTEYYAKQEYFDDVMAQIMSNTYRIIYKHPDLMDVYRLDYSVYERTIKTQTNCILKLDNVQKRKSNTYNVPQRYLNHATNALFTLQFYSLSQCLKKYKGEMPLTTYSDFFKGTISPLAGYDYTALNEKYFFDDCFILKTAVDDLNDAIYKCKQIVRKGNIRNSNGEVIKKKLTITFDEMVAISKIYELYPQLLISKCGYSMEKTDYISISEFKKIRKKYVDITTEG